MFLSLGIQQAMRMGHIVICGLSGSVRLCNFMSQTVRFSWKNLLSIKCVFWFSVRLRSETLHFLRINERDMIKTVHWSACKAPLFLSDFNYTWIFEIYFRKIIKYQISRKSVPWEPCVPRKQTDMTKLIVAFLSFASSSKNEINKTVK